MNVEYADDGKKVIIPVELWETFKDAFEHIQLYDLIREHRVSDNFSTRAEAEKNMKTSRSDRLMEIFNESKGVLPNKFRFDREEIHERQSVC